jgi:hypothetical protein
MWTVTALKKPVKTYTEEQHTVWMDHQWIQTDRCNLECGLLLYTLHLHHKILDKGLDTWGSYMQDGLNIHYC